MGLITIPAKTEDSLGQVKQDVGPYEDPGTQVPAAQWEAVKSAAIANALAIGLGSGTTPGSIEQRMQGRFVASGFDDFTESTGAAWEVDDANGGEMTEGVDPGPVGGIGAIALRVTTTAGSKVNLFRTRTRLRLTTELLLEWRFRADFGDGGETGNDDEFEWALGMFEPEEPFENHVVIKATWTPGSPGSYVHSLNVINGGSTTSDAFSMPALGEERAYVARMLVRPTGATLYMAVGEGAFSEVAAVNDPVAAVSYVPILAAEKAAGAGERTLALDYFRWEMAR